MRVRVRDLRLYFDVVGMGLVPDGPVMRERPVIVCLHGGPAFDHTPFKHLLPPLADVAQLVFLDQRACGRSDDCDPRLWTVDTWIEDVPALCEALELTRPILLGQWFGGFVALGVAARHPELPAKLIVSSSAGRLRPERALAMFERLGGPEARAVAAQWFEHPDADSSEAYRRTCLPLYNPTPADPDVMARARFRAEVGIRFWRDDFRSSICFRNSGASVVRR